MANLATIFSTVTRGAKLALELNELAVTAPDATYNLHRIAKSISNFSLTVKQIGTVIRTDDKIPSPEAYETLEDILEQCKDVYVEIKATTPSENLESNSRHDSIHSQYQGFKPSSTESARLSYLKAHLDALNSTLEVMLQVFNTAESVIWARTRPSISPQQEARAVANEKTQLQALIIEQQMRLLSLPRRFENSRPNGRLLMEQDSSHSLITREERGGSPKPTKMFLYQEASLSSLDPSGSESDWLAAVCAISKFHLEHLLQSWTCLRQLEEKIKDEERLIQAQRRQTQQPTCESDGSGDEVGALPKFRHNDARLSTPTPKRPTGVQPLFTDSTLPIPVPESKFGPAAPLSPASSYGVSPRSSGQSLPSPHDPRRSSQSPRSSITVLPTAAAAAVEARDKDDDLDLKVPWRLCSKNLYWDYTDGTIKRTNTDKVSSDAFSDRNSWTEILESWVDKEAIEEAGYNYKRVKKERWDGRRTRFETCFMIQRPLTFSEVRRLVERTAELYRQKRPRSPSRRRSSSDRPSTHQFVQPTQDRDQTPRANHPPLERSTTSYPFPPQPQAPPLDRSLSMPDSIPTYPPYPNPNLHKPSLNSPGGMSGSQHPQAPTVLQTGHYTPQTSPSLPKTAQYNPQTYNPQTYNQQPVPQYTASPQTLQPPPFSANYHPTYSGSPSATLDPRDRRSSAICPPSPLQQPYPQSSRTRNEQYSSTSTTSESESGRKERRHRSHSRRRPSSSHSHRSSGHTSHRRKGSSTVGTLAKVGGLAALLDGIVDLGVL
ncbi:hypothetical protein BCR34DRAFT_484535 [Clohesyomyces aquaticus]|uniref:DUF8035 domain-containing protein n=1 Tax=Clohesyomyces aquaticus TaxID=1231657 RepID=A0A1Y1ZLY0_9PLEO|nr:hypothetical protein BCR34DRAFT_484535 [Clohesyomyces aquaticus]